jgi:2-polyprenyl-3-methyl-5-hydroxy-6-metoxy-1,4-benzoquinol methylase
VLDAGCGTGENALELARRGLTVWGIDAAARAIQSAQTKAEDRGLSATFVVGDALDLASLGGRFESVLDCGLFHTFSDETQARYVDSLRDVVKVGGVVFVLCFSDLEPWGGGPRRLTQAGIRAAFAEGWKVDSIEPERFATRIHDDGARAWLSRIRRV